MTIKQIGRNKYEVVSHRGQNLGKTTSRASAVRRLQQVEYFKHQRGPLAGKKGK